MSERVERKILSLLDEQHISPYGNPIPGLEELGLPESPERFRDGVVSLTEVVGAEPADLLVRRIGEPAQAEYETLALLTGAGITPGATVTAHRESDGRVLVQVAVADADVQSLSLPRDVAYHVFVQQ